MSTPLSPRSYLFVPGDRPEKFAKACSAGADAIIVDLEDAVPAARKQIARNAIREWLAAEHPVWIRINGITSKWFEEDVELCDSPGVAGIVLPKPDCREDVEHVSSRLKNAALPILPIIETAQGMWNAHTIAQAASVQRLCFGHLDFQLDLGMYATEEDLIGFRSHLVLVSRIAGLQAPVDGVTTAIDNVQQLQADVARSRRLGFTGKLCIHPSQVEVVNRGFAPSAEEVTWARRILDSLRNADVGAARLDGSMVDRPVVLRAQRILESAREAEKYAESRSSPKEAQRGDAGKLLS